MAEKRVGTLAVYLTANSQGVKKGFNEARGYISGFAKWAAGLAGGITAGAFLKSTVEAWGAAEQGANRLRAVLAATSGSVGLSQKQLEDYASELQAATTYEDDAIIAMQTRLLTFGNLTGENFKRATALILDMAQATGQSAEGITAMIGKTLSNPAKYAEAMGKVGVSLTKAQIAEIKKLTAAGKTYEAQLIILDEMQKKFGGTAAAAADSVNGKITQMKNAWGDVQESVGWYLSTLLSVKDEAGNVTNVLSKWASTLQNNNGFILETRFMLAEVLYVIDNSITGLVTLWEILKKIVGEVQNFTSLMGKTSTVTFFQDFVPPEAIALSPDLQKMQLDATVSAAKAAKDAKENPEVKTRTFSEIFAEALDQSSKNLQKLKDRQKSYEVNFWKAEEDKKKKAEKPSPVVAPAPELKTVSEARKLVSAELFSSVEAYRTIKKAGLGDLQYKQVQIAEKSLGKLGEIADNTENAPELVEAM